MRDKRKRTAADWLLVGARVVAGGSLAGVGIILFLRLVRRPEFRWRTIRSPVLWTAAIAAAGLANTWSYLYRQYPTERPMSLFRLGVGVSLTFGLLAILVAAAVGFVVYGGARPGWGAALRRKGTLSDALLRAGIAAGGMLGLARWFHVVSSRVPALYDPDPTLPASLQYAIPAVDVVWEAARGGFAFAAMAAGAALALASPFFRTRTGRLLGVAAVLVALIPSSAHSPAEFASSLLPALFAAAWIAVCAFALLRDHAAAWAIFGLLAFGAREAIGLLAQPAAADRAAGAWSLLLLALAGIALLGGPRDPASPPPLPAAEGRSEGMPAPPTAAGAQ